MVGIIGAGAMGCLFAWFFERAGITPAVYEKNRDTAALLKKGLDVTAGPDRKRVLLSVSDGPDILKGCRILFLFVKSYATEAAAADLAGAVDGDSIIVTLQNGIGNMEVLAEYFPGERIVYGSTSIGAYKPAPGAVVLGGMGDITIGGQNSFAVREVESLFIKAGLGAAVTDRPDMAVWKKAIVNAGINPLGAILGVPNGALIENDHARAIQELLVKEAVAVARAAGLGLDFGEMLEVTREVCRKTAKNLCSMLQDIRAGRRTEIDSINGTIADYGRKSGVPAPAHELMASLIRARESMPS